MLSSREMIDEDKAACLIYIRVPYKDPRKGYALTSIVSRPFEDPFLYGCSRFLSTDSVKGRRAYHWSYFSCFIVSESDA